MHNLSKEEKDLLEKMSSDDYVKYVLDELFVERITHLYERYKKWFWIVITTVLLIVALFGFRQIQMSASFEADKKNMESLIESIQSELKKVSEIKMALETEKLNRDRLYSRENDLLLDKTKLVEKEGQMGSLLINSGNKLMEQSKEFYEDARTIYGEIKVMRNTVVTEKELISKDLALLKEELSKTDPLRFKKIEERIDSLSKISQISILKLTKDIPSQMIFPPIEYKVKALGGDKRLISKGTNYPITEGDELTINNLKTIVLMTNREFTIVAIAQQ